MNIEMLPKQAHSLLDVMMDSASGAFGGCGIAPK